MGLIPFFTLKLRRFVALTANLEKCPSLELPPLLLFYLTFRSPIASPVVLVSSVAYLRPISR